MGHKSIIVPTYCISVHYHNCCEFTDPSSGHGAARHGPARRRVLGVSAVNVVNTSDASSHHYRSCYGTWITHGRCDQLLASTFVDDSVLPYRRQLMRNVRAVLDTGVVPDLATAAV